ncbi:MAG: HAD hydrolase family protein [Clostridia bacterium]|nr:HAD hydrolase family protein [Clostridia bacterium]
MFDFSHYLIVTDLDGTFFGKGARLVEENLTAMERFKAAGGHITAGTGRIPANIRKDIPICGELFNAPAVTANGAFIYDLAADVCLHSTPMDAEATLAAARLVEELNPNVGMRVSTGQYFLVNRNRLNDAILRDIGDPDTYAGEVLPLNEWRTEGASWYKMVFRGEYEDLLSVRPAVEAAFGDTFEYSNSSPRFFELQKKGCTKATGLRFVADRLAEALGHPVVTVAVGDQENDLPMLLAAEIAACPANAVEAVKSVCSMHLCHHDEGCIADLMKKLEKEAF